MPGTNFYTPFSSTVDVALTDKNGYAALVRCASANIPSAIAGFAVGCSLQTTDTGATYQNEGTVTSCNFVELESAGGAWSGGTVPNASTFESTVTFEDVATFEVAPVLEAGAQIDGPIYTSGGVVPFVTGTVQAVVVASGAIDLTKDCHLIDTDADPLALTIGAPVIPYQKIVLQMIVDGGAGINDAVLTFNGTATITFDGRGDYVELQHNGADWIPVRLVNLEDGSIPTYVPAA